MDSFELNKILGAILGTCLLLMVTNFAAQAIFAPVKVGIAGERYFEVTSGLKDGDRVITGPFDSVRNLYDGDLVKVNTGPPGAAK